MHCLSSVGLIVGCNKRLSFQCSVDVRPNLRRNYHFLSCVHISGQGKLLIEFKLIPVLSDSTRTISITFLEYSIWMNSSESSNLTDENCSPYIRPTALSQCFSYPEPVECCIHPQNQFIHQMDFKFFPITLISIKYFASFSGFQSTVYCEFLCPHAC